MNSRGRTQTHAALVWRRLRRSKTAVAGLVIVGVYLFLALCGPWLAPYDPYFQDLNLSYLRPCMAHWLGCDEFGRDILSRLLYGARVSLVIQFWAVMISLAVGTFLGSASGYFGGKVDEIVMRLMDVMMAFPGILLALAIVAILGPSLTNLIVAIGINSVPGFSRVARGAVISVKKNDYVTAARAIGENDLSILFRYVLPNAISPIIVQTTMRMATVLLTAAGLGFLGLGVQPPSPEWGTMLSAARVYLRSAPHVAIIPGVTIMIVVLGFNFFGDGLQDALNPRLKE
ncbi:MULTISPECIES: nickel/cobalt ABC transporter permease [unclassified Pyramidobacter]|uniref:nickel/cobalt ABC transporter permease n=1 Tax=unclassified Pyramidobacter TaxID=2632171 RepID=UPI00098FEAE2|nr:MULTISPECIES: nickel/cobalt ABC transporter permease [unclassified Pyramidobacter]MCI6260033.1 ABC transporter permease [Pyramidobacter sp.]OON88135.1 glutathione ABC transporter permease GsiD [Pyramidobacter sp. C12-8]RKJ78993.1 ABC transporter permease [Pyramidobacter sp. CG50-2]WOL40136.1 ABC transporter permease [Pyramidobacter sp. YE332]